MMRLCVLEGPSTCCKIGNKYKIMSSGRQTLNFCSCRGLSPQKTVTYTEGHVCGHYTPTVPTANCYVYRRTCMWSLYSHCPHRKLLRIQKDMYVVTILPLSPQKTVTYTEGHVCGHYTPSPCFIPFCFMPFSLMSLDTVYHVSVCAV